MIFKKQKGITLLEVLAAIILFTLGTIAAYNYFPFFFSSEDSYWKTVEMTMLAQDKIEEILVNNRPITTEPHKDYPLIIGRDKQGHPSGYRKWHALEASHSSSSLQIVMVEVVWHTNSRVNYYNLIGAVLP